MRRIIQNALVMCLVKQAANLSGQGARLAIGGAAAFTYSSNQRTVSRTPLHIYGLLREKGTPESHFEVSLRSRKNQLQLKSVSHKMDHHRICDCSGEGRLRPRRALFRSGMSAPRIYSTARKLKTTLINFRLLVCQARSFHTSERGGTQRLSRIGCRVEPVRRDSARHPVTKC